MNPDSENFDRLRTLLKIKRYESPPPGFFDQFPAKVIARIEAGDAAAGMPWWERFMQGLSFRPGLALSCGAAACLALLTGAALLQEAPDEPTVLGAGMQGAFVSVPSVDASTSVVLPFGSSQGPALSRTLLATNDPRQDAVPALLFNPNGLLQGSDVRGVVYPVPRY